MRYKRLNIISVCFLLLTTLLGGCFTGIESTKKIKLSREDVKALQPTPEELLLSGVNATSFRDWPSEKLFIVVGERGSVLFEPRRIISGNYRLDVGDSIYYIGSQMNRLPDGTVAPLLLFARGDDRFSFTGGKASENLMSDALPGLVDPEMLDKVKDILMGRILWTLNAYKDEEKGGENCIMKFEEVTVKDVKPGNMIFPIRIVIEGQEENSSSILMNFGNSGKDSRSFANLFSLEDPRKRHSSISDRVWQNIMKGIVETGMTKEECRLAKGNPNDVNSGHDYQHALLIWSYPDGTVLYFVDGILQGINNVPRAN